MIDVHDAFGVPASAKRRRGLQISKRRSTSKPAARRVLSITRTFSDAKVNPFDQIEWHHAEAVAAPDCVTWEKRARFRPQSAMYVQRQSP